MFLKNMADWGLHNGMYFFTIFVSYLAKKKVFTPQKYFLKMSPCLKYHHKLIEWNNNNKLSMKRKTIILSWTQLIIKLINWFNNLMWKFNYINQLI
jgi:hypothetical protein